VDPFSLASIGSLLGGGQFGGGQGSTSQLTPISSSISGATSFTTGGLTVNESGSSLLIVAGLAVLAAVILLRKR
jgi:hypothetical protein